MNIAYVRKTQKSFDEVVAALKSGAKERGLEIKGESVFSSGKGLVVHIYDAKRAEKIINADPMLIGLVPSAALVQEKEGKTILGLLNPQLLMGSPAARELEALVEEMGRDLRSLVNDAAGVGDPKVERVKLYSTATCPYCKMEKDYLEKYKIPFEVVMVDADRKSAEEMMQKSGHSGVPQTEIVFDDGDSELVIGFDKGRLNQLLGIGA